VCKWLNIEPGDFLGFKGREEGPDQPGNEPPAQISAHFRVDKLPRPETATALARMLLFVAAREARGEFSDGDA
jgi:hypothetical protein